MNQAEGARRVESIQAIPTNYKGYRMRSRLEARWAVFFDALGLSWEYEQEGYVCGTSAWLPDFVIGAHHQIPVEIKPADYDKIDLDGYISTITRVTCFSVEKGQSTIARSSLLIFGTPWAYTALFLCSGYESGDVLNVRFSIGRRDDREIWLQDSDNLFAECLLDFNADDSGRYPLDDHPKLEAAVIASKSARFEFGESGATV